METVTEFVCKESKETLRVYDYLPSKFPLKFKATRNDEPIILQMIPTTFSGLDIRGMVLCPGIPETKFSHGNIGEWLIERFGPLIVYRSKDCLQLCPYDSLRCQKCDKDQRVTEVYEENGSLENDNIKHEKDSDDTEDDQYQGLLEYKEELITDKSMSPVEEGTTKIKFSLQEYNCSKCDFMSTNLRKVTKHEKLKHKKELLNIKHHKGRRCGEKWQTSEMKFNFICSECGKNCKTAQGLSNHTRAFHKEIRDATHTFLCSDCGRNFDSEQSLKQHKQSHHQSEHSMCNLCGMVFESKSKLSTHIVYHHKNAMKVQCSHCGKTYNNKEALRSHNWYHHLDKEKLPCEECGKIFESQAKLRNHKAAVHEKLKLWICEVCNFRTATNGNLNLHRVKNHQSEKRTADEYRALVRSGNHPYCKELDERIAHSGAA